MANKYLKINNKVVYGINSHTVKTMNGEDIQKVDLGPLCFTANSANSTVELIRIGSLSILYTSYSFDRQTWISFVPSTTAGSNRITLENIGDKVYFRNDILSGFSNTDHLQFVMSGSISASGNVNSIYTHSGFNSLNTLSENYCYYCLFYNCTSLTTPPALPATTLSTNCYNGMFYGCTSLTTAPALPATTLAANCYFGMFYGCTSLTTAPALPATTLANYCYSNIFKGCTSLQVSDTQTAQAPYAWYIPTSGTFTNTTTYNQAGMFQSCLGTRSSNDMSGAFGGKHTYYTQNQPVSPVITYSITPTLTNVTASASNPTTIIQGGTATLVFNADSGYNLPDSVSVTGATASWTKATGVLVLSNPTGNVSFSISGVIAWENPVQDGSNLTITQTYLATQSDSDLTIQ